MVEYLWFSFTIATAEENFNVILPCYKPWLIWIIQYDKGNLIAVVDDKAESQYPIKSKMNCIYQVLTF